MVQSTTVKKARVLRNVEKIFHTKLTLPMKIVWMGIPLRCAKGTELRQSG